MPPGRWSGVQPRAASSLHGNAQDPPRRAHDGALGGRGEPWWWTNSTTIDRLEHLAHPRPRQRCCIPDHPRDLLPDTHESQSTGGREGSKIRRLPPRPRPPARRLPRIRASDCCAGRNSTGKKKKKQPAQSASQILGHRAGAPRPSRRVEVSSGTFSFFFPGSTQSAARPRVVRYNTLRITPLPLSNTWITILPTNLPRSWGGPCGRHQIS